MRILKNNNGSTLILMTVIIIAATLTVTLTVADIVRNGLIMDRTQLESTKAFFAAEAGAEKVLYEFRYNIEFPPGVGGCQVPSNATLLKYICFDALTDGAISDCVDAYSTCISGGNEDHQEMPGNSAVYQLKYQWDDNGTKAYTTLSSTGVLGDVKRSVQLKYEY